MKEQGGLVHPRTHSSLLLGEVSFNEGVMREDPHSIHSFIQNTQPKD